MSKGKAKTDLLHTQGMVGLADAPDYGFLYQISTIKDPKWNIGDVVEPGNGKGFVYCKSGGACWTGQGNMINNAIPATGIDYALLAAAQAVGDKLVQMTAVLTHTENDLKGGTILLKTATDSTNAALQCRGIIGNTASAIAGTITIYLDAPLTGALTTASYGYCMPSPYSDVRYGNTGGKASHVGVAATYVSAANVYHWEQFKGRVMGLASQADVGTQAFGRSVVWRHDGSIQLAQTTDGVNGLLEQLAGYIVDNNAALNGSTEVMLTGNV